MDAYYHLEQFDELERCIDKLPEKDPLLSKLAEMLASVGNYQANLIKIFILNIIVPKYSHDFLFYRNVFRGCKCLFEIR